MRFEITRAVEALEAELEAGNVHAVVAPSQNAKLPLLVWARDGSETSTLYEGGHYLPALALTAYGRRHADADALMERALDVLRRGNMLAEEPDDPIDDYDVEPKVFSVDVSVMIRTV